MNSLPSDFEERVYAGVLGKIIGVYLGRPFEGWTNQKIEAELGEVWYYVHEKLNKPLVVPDDDISGTFTFLRALEDHAGAGHKLTAEQIGKTWLNYLIEKRTVLWWGGVGVSTEHTAYDRLKNGVPAPMSGSMARNGQVVAEQIGAQIFIDGWAMVCPGDPEKAVALAGKAASVSHDGEAVYAAQVIAALEAQAFVEPDLDVLLDYAKRFIPRTSLVYRLIEDIRGWKSENPNDWRATFRKIEAKYGYDKYGGNCHVIPNHAVILLALLHGDDDFQKSLMIANTAGWDTDCNSANVGCIMGIKNGLKGINRGADFRTPVADKMYLPTADGGRCITDAVQETYHIVNMARMLQNQRPLRPNHGMRFHFNLPGSVQGFTGEDTPGSRDVVRLENVGAHEGDVNGAQDERMLAIHYSHVAPGRIAHISTPTFLPKTALGGVKDGYAQAASPTLYSGQTIRARLLADEKNTRPAPVRLYVRVYSGASDELETLQSAPRVFAPGESSHFHWDVPDTGGRPVAEVGVSIGGAAGSGTLYLDWMGWGGAPTVTFRKPDNGGSAWRKAWVTAVDSWHDWSWQPSTVFALVQNQAAPGLLLTGECGWCDYEVSTTVYPHLAEQFGLVAFAQGLRRYVAFVLDADKTARLIERYDDTELLLAEAPCPWNLYDIQPISLVARRDGSISACYGSGENSMTLIGQIAEARSRGAIGLLAANGHVQFGPVSVAPAPPVEE